ncbi:hypothetical protein [Paratractidigestivibacter sp.]|uniref:hypothetical protein n=1 Tax=Paratractidigestivibacter sp. TaxID=2847316 RepID=UPI002ACB0E46|nr:hypothetical protein [Paratractidigestivibacter sp.]
MRIYQVIHTGDGSKETAIFKTLREAQRIAASIWFRRLSAAERKTHSVAIWSFYADLSKLREDYLAEYGLPGDIDPNDISIETWESILYDHGSAIISEPSMVEKY